MISTKQSNFTKLCRSVLKLSEDIIFVGIVDRNGKLLAGESNNYFMPKGRCLYCQNSTFYGFYFFCLVDLLQETDCYTCSPKYCTKIHFAALQFGNTRLITAPLTQERGNYLCIQMQESSVELELNTIATMVDSFFSDNRDKWELSHQ